VTPEQDEPTRGLWYPGSRPARDAWIWVRSSPSNASSSPTAGRCRLLLESRADQAGQRSLCWWCWLV